jgi:hypothetical protein
MRMMKLRLLLMICILQIAPAHAYDRQLAKASLAGELSECAAYFIVVAEFAEHRGEAGVADHVAMTAEVLMDGSTALIGEDATKAGFESAKRRHVAFLQDPVNFPRIVERYNAPCMALFRDPGTRMQYWLDKL